MATLREWNRYRNLMIHETLVTTWLHPDGEVELVVVNYGPVGAPNHCVRKFYFREG